MKITGFTASDFNVFKIAGLEDRMSALQERLRPKLEALGQHLAGELAVMTGEEMYYHVAKHARRTINPPNDTWVAFSSNKRGYKMMPHFQIGLWETHVFIWFALIYEAPNKGAAGAAFEQNIDQIVSSIPGHFVWSGDHTIPDAAPGSELTKDGILALFQRVQNVKSAEILCGLHIPREEAVSMSADKLTAVIHDVFETLIPLYKLS
ncbi:YktB family protein [Peribacillus sp. SCS-26]|uniref:YktB family protein n=1 Tax=Paraperibacillus marinus TaxID=3115295 RepID=UPI0039060CF0